MLFLKLGKQNTEINNEKRVKEESVKDTDIKVSVINTISGKQNAFKGINSCEKLYHNLQAQDSSKLLLHAFDSCTF